MYKKTRFFFRFLSALFSKYYLYIIAGAVLSVVSFFAVPYLLTRLPTFRTTVHIAVIGKYSLTNLPDVIAEKISVGLTTVSPAGEPGPGIAKSWEISPDGKTITFLLNPQARWQDGRPLKSSDIKYQFRGAQIEYPDPSHLLFRLKDPYAPLPTLLAHPVIHYETSKILKSTRILGFGSYKVSSFKNSGGVLETIQLSPVEPDTRLPILVFKFFSTAGQARTAYKLGLIDQISDLSDLGELLNWPNVAIDKHPSLNRYLGLFFNTQSPSLSGQSGKNLRLAISYAIDKSKWTNRAVGPISVSNWSFFPDTKRYDQDFKRAVELIKKVEKIPEKLIIHTVPAYLSLAEEIKADLGKVGLNVGTSVVQDIPSEFDLLLIAQTTPVDPDQYNFWHSTQSNNNLTRLNNPRIDKLLEDGRRTYDKSARIKIYQDFQKFLIEEVPAVFLYYPDTFTITRK